MVVFPNAKINIGLNIIRKRNDGYHDLETIFYPIGLKDGLEFVENGTSEVSFSCSGIDVAADSENNLVVKAYRLMQQAFGLPGIDIHLHKTIPFGAGLGGGSADAAFMLKGLNDFFKLGVSDQKLRSLAVKLGADCPFFINNVPSFATGVGEKLEAVTLDLSGWNLVLIKSPVEVSTAEAYSRVVPAQPDLSVNGSINQPIEQWMSNISNDFEESVFSLYPVIGEIKSKLVEHGAVYASMSGSGSSVFGLFREMPVIDMERFPPGTFLWKEIL
jgi:4-diphosphocytidyl-2-C-methyl-D-erythritol kinase